MKRTLNLKREALAELTSGDLAAVAGGAPYSNDQITCPNLMGCLGLDDGVSRLVTCRGCITGLGC